jgi:hypothetical protein
MPRCFAGPGVVMPTLSGFDKRRRIGVMVASEAPGRVHDSQCLRRFSAAIRSTASELQHKTA